MAEKLKINVSFPQYDKHIYDFIKAQKNPSAFIRKLVEAYMNGVLGNMIVQQGGINQNINYGFNPILQTETKIEEIVVTEEDDKENEDIDTGEFTPEYKIKEEQLNQIDSLPF